MPQPSSVSTQGHGDIVDVTVMAQGAVLESGLTEGILTLFAPGSPQVAPGTCIAGAAVAESTTTKQPDMGAKHRRKR